MKRIVDLHTHTTASDGSCTPSELVALARTAGLSAVAITDHDSVSGIDEAVAAGNDMGVEVVPGVEISVGERDDMHILGLLIDHKNERLNRVMNFLKSSRRERNMLMIDRLRNMGFDISYNELCEQTGADNLGRLHIAYELEKKGYIKEYGVAFKSFLSMGGEAYVSRLKLSEREGIDAILRAGGIPILAHISYLRKSVGEIEKTLKRLKALGLMGVEAYHSSYDEETERLANDLAEKLELLKSGGTDFHGSHRPRVYLGTGRGGMCLPYELLDELKKAAGQTDS